MRNIRRSLLIGCAFLAMTGCAGASARGRMTQLQEIAVRPGPNQVSQFVEDGRSGMITQGWRDLGHEIGYPVYTVMIPSANPARGWDIVPLETNDRQGSSDISGSARFARGWLDGKPTTFVFTARRDPDSSGDASKPAVMLVEAYHLVTARKGDKSENAFVPVTTVKSSDRVCNPSVAIAREFGLDEPSDYERHGSCG